ncbi:MAG TPA: alpha/beta fold hydrolase [Conexibacter sp.]|nr:alpha/beta fold hydrolase [Conexibacter sp.]
MPSNLSIRTLTLAAGAALALIPAASAHGAVLTRCNDLPTLVSARCGTIVVPLDRAAPQLGTTTVAYAFVPRRLRSKPSLGTIVYNPGGPGDAPIASAPLVVAGMRPLLARRDLLLVDPRGSGRSDRLRCPALEDPAFAFASHRRTVAAIGACGRSLGPRAGAYSTVAVADDIEAVRAALGRERLDLWGESYGTYLMTVFAARHPQHVQSILLSGAYPLAFDPWGRDRLAAARRALRGVCALTHRCNGRRALADLATVAARLRREPLNTHAVVGTRRVTVRIDEAALAGLLYADGDPERLVPLPAALAAAHAGDLAPLRRLAVRARMGLAQQMADPAAARSYSPAQSWATQCADYPRAYSYLDPPGVRRDAYVAARDALDPRTFAPFSAAGWTQAGFEAVDWCLGWPGKVDATLPSSPDPRPPRVPVLVLSGALDANTPVRAGRQAAAQFPAATFLTVAEAGHTPTRSQCGVRLALRFVATHQANPRACAPRR